MKKYIFAFLTAAIFTSSNVLAESDAVKLNRIVFSQYCFWSAEQRLGQIDGVHTTQAGFYDGHEVTSVMYDPMKISAESLYSRARQLKVADSVYLDASETKLLKGAKVFNVSGYRVAPASDQKRQLLGTPLERVKMSDFQRTKVNSFYRTDTKKALSFLNKKQLSGLKSR